MWRGSTLRYDAEGRAHIAMVVNVEARDVSGGFSNPSPGTKPDCVAGTDMTWSRLAVMPSIE